MTTVQRYRHVSLKEQPIKFIRHLLFYIEKKRLPRQAVFIYFQVKWILSFNRNVVLYLINSRCGPGYFFCMLFFFLRINLATQYDFRPFYHQIYFVCIYQGASFHGGFNWVYRILYICRRFHINVVVYCLHAGQWTNGISDIFSLVVPFYITTKANFTIFYTYFYIFFRNPGIPGKNMFNCIFKFFIATLVRSLKKNNTTSFYQKKREQKKIKKKTAINRLV